MDKNDNTNSIEVSVPINSTYEDLKEKYPNFVDKRSGAPIKLINLGSEKAEYWNCGCRCFCSLKTFYEKYEKYKEITVEEAEQK